MKDYVVMRRPGCMPFLETVRDVGRKWLTADPVTPNGELRGDEPIGEASLSNEGFGGNAGPEKGQQ